MATKGDGSVKVVLSAVAGNSIVTVAKFLGWVVSGSPSMLAEGIHSAADTFNQFLLFIGIKQSQRDASPKFPRGYGQSRYLWNLVSAVGIFFVGFGVTTYHGIHSLIDKPAVSENINWVAVGVLAFALVIESIPLLLAIKEVNRQRESTNFLQFLKTSDDPTTIGVLLEDSIAVLGVILAILGIWLSYFFQTSLPDAITTIFIGILLGLMAVILAVVNGRFLIGQAIPKSRERELRMFISSLNVVEKVTYLTTEVLAPGKCHLNLEVELHGGYMLPRDEISRDAQLIKMGVRDPAPILVDTAERMVRIVGNEINRIEAEIRKNFPEVISIGLEVN